MKKLFTICTTILFFVICSMFGSNEFKIVLIKSFNLDQSKQLIVDPGDMAIDEDETIFLTDRKDSNIKIYSREGDLVNVFGRRGAGPHEFDRPNTIDCSNKKLCFYDLGNRYYYIYDYSSDFRLERKFFFFTDGTKFVLSGDNIISNNFYLEKSGEYRGVILDLDGNLINKLIRIPYPRNDAKNRFFISQAFIDVSRTQDIYYVLKKDLKIHKFDRKGNEIEHFGKKPKFYIQPRMTNSYQKALRSRVVKTRTAFKNWYNSFTWVSGLAVLDDILLLVISHYNSQFNKWNHWIQIYDLDGNLLQKEKKLEEIGTSSDILYMDSNHNNKIYILESHGEIDPIYKLFVYKIMKK